MVPSVRRRSPHPVPPQGRPAQRRAPRVHRSRRRATVLDRAAGLREVRRAPEGRRMNWLRLEKALAAWSAWYHRGASGGWSDIVNQTASDDKGQPLQFRPEEQTLYEALDYKTENFRFPSGSTRSNGWRSSQQWRPRVGPAGTGRRCTRNLEGARLGEPIGRERRRQRRRNHRLNWTDTPDGGAHFGEWAIAAIAASGCHGFYSYAGSLCCAHTETIAVRHASRQSRRRNDGSKND